MITVTVTVKVRPDVSTNYSPVRLMFPYTVCLLVFVHLLGCGAWYRAFVTCFACMRVYLSSYFWLTDLLFCDFPAGVHGAGNCHLVKHFR